MKIRYKLFILALLIIFLTTVGLGWLAFGILVFGLIYVLVSSQLKWVKWIRANSWMSGILSVLALFSIAILLRLFVLEIFSIPSSSMEGTLRPGDHILLSKLNYGPQLPRSPFQIPWVNLFFFLNQEARAKAGEDWWDYRRLNGYSAINRNDIVVFELPSGNREPYIKRCIGLPGEKFEIIAGQPFCNGKKVSSPPGIQNRYQLWSNNPREVRRQMDSLKIPLRGMNSNKGDWEVLLSIGEKDLLEKLTTVDSIKQKLLPPGEGYRPFPNHDKYTWSIDYFGPLIIPARGMKVEINADNFLFYKDILRDFEGIEVVEQDGRYLSGGTEIKEHTFKQDYYFMLDDHRNDSKDSRFIGFVPEVNIIGKAVCILFSNGQNGMEWGRTLNGL